MLVPSKAPWVTRRWTAARPAPCPAWDAPAVPSTVLDKRSAKTAREPLKPMVLMLAMLLPMTPIAPSLVRMPDMPI